MKNVQAWGLGPEDKYLIVCPGDLGALSLETTDAELVYTREVVKALSYSSRDLAESSPWFCWGDLAITVSEFNRLCQECLSFEEPLYPKIGPCSPVDHQPDRG